MDEADETANVFRARADKEQAAARQFRLMEDAEQWLRGGAEEPEQRAIPEGGGGGLDLRRRVAVADAHGALSARWRRALLPCS